MSTVNTKQIKIAILDLYEGQANEGMRCLRQIISDWKTHNNYLVEVKEFDVRLQQQLPYLSFDIYVSSGGPGSPLNSKGEEWDTKYFEWLDSVLNWNNNYKHYPKKQVFFICHSFQLACRHLGVGNIARRNKTAFGIFPIHMCDAGKEETVFEGLCDPFFGVDSRDYQVVQPMEDELNEGVKILAIEKDRPHTSYERALMAVRFNESFIGTQFHPEADAAGMSMYLQQDEKKETVIKNHGEAKWKSMIEQLNDPDKILWTYKHILPNFLNMAVGELQVV